MNRRTFLKTIGAVTASAVVPTPVLATLSKLEGAGVVQTTVRVSPIRVQKMYRPEYMAWLWTADIRADNNSDVIHAEYSMLLDDDVLNDPTVMDYHKQNAVKKLQTFLKERYGNFKPIRYSHDR